MAAHGEPRALGGDAHRLVVVALRSTTGEGVVEPEVLRFGNRVGNVGESGCAFIGGDHEIGVLAIADNHMSGMHDLAFDDVVRQRKQRADEDLIARLALGQPAVAVLDRIR